MARRKFTHCSVDQEHLIAYYYSTFAILFETEDYHNSTKMINTLNKRFDIFIGCKNTENRRHFDQWYSNHCKKFHALSRHNYSFTVKTPTLCKIKAAVMSPLISFFQS